MKIVIVYDSIFGNTALIARTIAAALGAAQNTVSLLTVQEAKSADLTGTDLLIVGSPTRGFRPTPAMSEYTEGVSSSTACRAAVFDTRLDVDTIQPAPLRWVVEAGGYAAARIAASLTRHGYKVDRHAAGFLVTGTEGPLKAGELDRAAGWARELIA